MSDNLVTNKTTRLSIATLGLTILTITTLWFTVLRDSSR